MNPTAMHENARVRDCDNCAAREARLAAAGQRFQAAARFRASRGAAEIRPAAVPGELRVGERRTVRVDLAATRETSVLDPDHCVSKALAAGLRVEARGRVGGGQTSDRFCLPASTLTLGNTREFRVPIEGTSPGTLEVTIEVVGRDSGNLLARETFAISVVGEETGGETPGGIPDEEQDGGEDQDQNGGGPLLPCFVDPNRSCARPEALGWGAAAVLLLVALVGG